MAKIQKRNLKNILLLNHWANFNQTWHKAFLGDEDSSFFQFNSIKEQLENGYLAIIFITYKSCCWFIFFLKTKEFYLYLRKENVGLGFYLETPFDCDPPPPLCDPTGRGDKVHFKEFPWQTHMACLFIEYKL